MAALNASLILTLSVYLLFVVSCAVIFLCGDAEDPGILGRCNRMFSIQLPNGIKRAIRHIPWLGPRIVNAAENGYDYVCFRPNPLLQLLYLSLVLGGYAIFCYRCLPYIPNRYIPWYHTYVPHAAVALTLITFYLASNKSPGYVNEKSVDLYLKSYEFDQFIYVKQECKTCKVIKPARSKHCPICRTCVATFDHHCPWVNTCVGERNKKHFLGFLFATSCLLSYATYLLVGIIFHHIDRHNLLTQQFVNRKTGERVNATYMIITQFLMTRYGPIIMLLVLCTIMGFVLWGFLFYHIYLVARGTTTNEVAKWDSVKDFYKGALKRHREAQVKAGAPKPPSIAATTPLSRRPAEEYPEELPANQYNFGFITNMYDVFFPRCERNFANMTSAQPETGPSATTSNSEPGTSGKLRRRRKR